MKKLNTIFMGNPEFCIKALKELHDNEQINLSLICGGLDKKIGRGQKVSSPASIEFAKKNNIPFIQCENINKSDEFFTKTSELEVDLIVVFAFSHFLGKRILELPKIGCFNIHTSLLPKYRGSSPIHYALLNGDSETGISIQKMVKKMDAGDILVSHKIAIDENDDFFNLCNKFHDNLSMVIKKFVEAVSRDKISFFPQDEALVTFAPLITKKDGLISTSTDSYFSINNKVRALKAWPGVYCYLNKNRYKIHEVELSKKNIECGKVSFDNNNIYIGLKSETIAITQIQPPGKKAMKTSDFLNGFSKDLSLTLTEDDTQD